MPDAQPAALTRCSPRFSSVGTERSPDSSDGRTIANIDMRRCEGLDLTYLNPPPAPAPVIVVKDVGGLVRDYEAQTEFYRRTDREVRVHECHSACTLALSLPNVCVYPDSIFKFHQAYDLRDHRTDLGVSEQLFDAYPAPVRARLGTLTRKFKILSGAELISLGVRNCNTPRIMLAAKEPAPRPASGNPVSRVWANVMSVFGNKAVPRNSAAHTPTQVATRQQTATERNLSAETVFNAVPMPPQRPASAQPGPDESRFGAIQTAATQTEAIRAGAPQVAETQPVATAVDVPSPPQRPMSLTLALRQPMQPIALPKVIGGAQPILPPHFLAYAVIAQLGSLSNR